MGTSMRARWLDTQHARSLRLLALLAAAVPLFICGVATAITPISQQFLSDSTLPLGSIVSLRKDSSEYIDIASNSNANNIIGVVISQDSSPISLSSTQANETQIATSGIVQVLVSNINGDIKTTDQITASPIGGVGMKATSNVKVVGIAQQDLASSGHTEKQTYTDKAGAKHTITLGEIPVLISVSYFFKQPDKTIIPAAVQNVANALAGRTVNTVPILICLAIFIVTIVVVVTLIYTMIHSSIISVGRNPMAQAAVYRNLIQLSGLIVVILSVSIVSIYLVLTKF